MEVGTEISKKIRSAIKAKLLELGSYVDDELPDYIMVMVANKKNRAQMRNDLCLFLGNNTDAFTEWLHDLLTKLQKINETDQTAVDSGKVKSKEKKKEKSKKKDGKKDKAKDGKSKMKAHQGTTTTSVIESSKENETETVRARNSTDINEDSVSVEKTQSSDTVPNDSKDNKTKDDADVEDVRQLLVTEEPSDDLARELQTEAETVVSVITKAAQKLTSPIRSTSSVSKEKDDVPPSPPRRTQIVHKLNRSRSLSPERSVQARKRKAPISSVVASIRREEDEEEEYDPYNPAVGSVASVVKVTKRKSSIRPDLQANRSLLVKAMSEAERSIAVKRQVGVTRPMSRDESPAETYSPKRKRSDGLEREETPLPYIPSKKENKQVIKEKQKGMEVKLSQSDARHVLNKEERKELISQSRRRELLRAIGIDREETKSSSPIIENNQGQREETSKFEYRREVKGDSRSDGVRNFTITARVQPSKASDNLRDSLKRKSSSSQSHSRLARDLSSSPEPKESRPIASRLGKVVVERTRSSSRDKEAGGKIAKIGIQQTVSSSRGRERMALSRLGKDLVNKQCKAAVQSVKGMRSAHSRLSDSRVVQCDKEDDTRVKEEKPRSASVGGEQRYKVCVKEEKSGVMSEEEEEEEDLANMLKDSGSEPLDDLQADEFTLDLDEEDLSQVLEREAAEERKRLEKDAELTGSKKGTRFIVTLDGVDEQQYTQETAKPELTYSPVGPIRASEQIMLSGMSPQIPAPMQPGVIKQATQYLHPSVPLGHHHPVPIATVAAKATPPKIQPFSISLKDSDDEQEGKTELTGVVPPMVPYQETVPVPPQQQTGLTALQKAKQNERCKFWPACVAGAECEYHHPTSHCKTFPNCRFGDKCLFIHPNCRFDSKCMRPDCPYTHSSRPSISAAKVIAIPQSHVLIPPKLSYPAYSSSNTVCRFYPNCLNVNCTFLHPKPCRFGSGCLAQGCPFYHPTVPGKDKLKWQAAPQTAPTQNTSTTTAVQASSKPKN